MDEGGWMSLRREFETLLSEFLPDKEEIRREIEQEWDRMREGGQEIRPGDASKRALLRWASGEARNSTTSCCAADFCGSQQRSRPILRRMRRGANRTLELLECNYGNGFR
jgi:RecB family exonuclease